MKILIVLPPGMPTGGNWTYSGRLQRGLSPRGICITRKAMDDVTGSDFESADIIHSYNAYVTGRHLAPVAKQVNKPLVLTMTGTDVNEHLTNPETAPSMLEAVEYASKIVFLTDTARERLSEMFPNTATKSQVVNLGIDLPPSVGKTRADYGFTDDEFVFLLVAGLRGVKRPLHAFHGLLRVYEQHPQVRFALAGSELDPTWSAAVQEAVANHPNFARYLGPIPYEEMRDLFAASNVAMNTSSSEGLSHALLEAMSVGRPVLATDVPGNFDLIQDGVNGFLFASDDELVDKATRLVTDPALLDRLVQGGHDTIEQHFSLARELDAFHDLYTSIMAKRPCTADV